MTEDAADGQAHLDKAVHDLRAVVEALLDNAEAERRELLATLQYVVSLLLADEATRSAAVAELVLSLDFSPVTPNCVADTSAERWRPSLITGGSGLS